MTDGHFDEDVLEQLEADAEAQRALDNRTEEAEPPKSVQEVGDRLIEAKAALDELKEELSAVQAEYDRLRKVEMPRALEAAGIKNFTTDSGFRIATRTDHYAGVKKDDEQKLFAWLRDTGNGSLIRETVHHKTLSSFARELLASQGAGSLPEFLNVHSEVVAYLTRVNKSQGDE